jgi:hypothetical protein
MLLVTGLEVGLFFLALGMVIWSPSSPRGLSHRMLSVIAMAFITAGADIAWSGQLVQELCQHMTGIAALALVVRMVIDHTSPVPQL